MTAQEVSATRIATPPSDALTENEITTLKTYAQCDMSVARTAARLYYHRNTIMQRLGIIREKTGLNPRCFYDLIKLLQIIRKEEKRARSRGKGPI